MACSLTSYRLHFAFLLSNSTRQYSTVPNLGGERSEAQAVHVPHHSWAAHLLEAGTDCAPSRFCSAW